MHESSCSNNSTAPFIVLIMNWKGTGSHWIKGFDSLQQAQYAVEKKYAENQEIGNRVIILKGEIKQIGIHASSY